MSVLSAKEARRLSLGFPALDEAFSGFEAGDFAVLHGNAASFAFSLLSVRCQFPHERGGLDSSVIFVDGGNMLNPYLIAEIAQSYGLDSTAVLERIYVSRAFTAYQLSSLILEKLDSALKKHRVQLLIVSDISSLFLDRDVPKVEAREFFMKICVKLAETASAKQIITIAGCFPERCSAQEAFFEAVLFGKCNVVISLEKTGNTLSFALEDHPKIKPFSIDVPVDFASLPTYLGGVGFGQNRPFV
jgi:hypothetical protein